MAPVFDAFDAERAQDLGERLLEAVASRSATLVSIDVTGAGVADSQAADALSRAAARGDRGVAGCNPQHCWLVPLAGTPASPSPLSCLVLIPIRKCLILRRCADPPWRGARRHVMCS